MSMLRRHREKAQGFTPPAPPLTHTLRREDHQAIVVELTKSYEQRLSQAQAELEECAQAYRRLHRDHRLLEQKRAELEAKVAEFTKGEPVAPEATPVAGDKPAAEEQPKAPPPPPERKAKATKSTKGDG